jgi:hypothetical protein
VGYLGGAGVTDWTEKPKSETKIEAFED